MNKPEDDGLGGTIDELKKMSTEELEQALNAMSSEERRKTVVGIVRRFRDQAASG